MKEIAEIQMAARALQSALSVVEGQGNPAEAKEFTKAYQQEYKQPKTPEGYAIAMAIRRVCGQPVKLDSPGDFANPPEGSWMDRATGMACISWTHWALENGNTEAGLYTIKQLRSDIEASVGVIEGMVLQCWADAIEALYREEPVSESRKLYQRATILGSQYGTKSNPVIQWTYAATFFPKSV